MTAMDELTHAQQTVLLEAVRAAHEANQIYCASLGDPLSLAWEDLPKAQIDGMLRGALHALENGDPSHSHQLWYEDRVANGWTFGPVKDPARKISPNLIPYAELPEAQKRKDILFQGIVRAYYFARTASI